VASSVSHTDLAADLASFSAGLQWEDLSPDVVEMVKADILDTLSCVLAGSSAEVIAEISSLVRDWGGQPQAEMLVFGGRFPAHHAAWVNSAMAHARDYDDTHDAAILHAGVSVIPAALAAGQLRGKISGRDLIASVAAGLEVMCRLGVGIDVDIVTSGFIYSSLLGYFGATAAAGRALGLDAEQMWHALGIVYSSAAGNHQVTRDASQMKRLQPGLAAQAAVVAVQLAARGIRGPVNVFEGADGFFRVYLQNQADPRRVREDLGKRFELLNLSFKPYPCCRDTHSTIDAVLQLRRGASRPPDDIESIEVGLTGPGYQMVCVPEEVRQHPTSVVQAQFSIPYAAATGWVDGAVQLGHFHVDALQRRDILELAQRVRPYVDDELDRDWHRFVTPAKVTVRFRDGSVAQARIDYPLGHPNAKMTPDQLAAKAADCAAAAARALTGDTAARLAAAVGRLDEIDDADQLIAVMT
jgi:2-methylcitrate dehydratase PrpD